MSQAVELQPVPEPPRSPKVERALERVFTEAKTVADTFCIVEEELLETRQREEAFITSLPIEERETMRRIFANVDAEMRRRLEPWPKWAVQLAAEIFAVRWPTIPKETIQEGFALIHFCFFEWRLDRSVPFPKHQFESFDPVLLGAMFGHAVAVSEDMQRKLADFAKRKLLSPEKHAKYQQEFSIEKPMAEMAGPLKECLEKNPQFIIRFSEGLANAKANTFDKNGNPKASPLLPVYEKIFEDWPEVEAMSGVTELCRFLDPLLNEKESDKKLERVKQIRRRLGVVFKGQVKGTA